MTLIKRLPHDHQSGRNNLESCCSLSTGMLQVNKLCVYTNENGSIPACLRSAPDTVPVPKKLWSAIEISMYGLFQKWEPVRGSMSLSLAVPQPLAYSDSRNLSWQKASNAARLRDQKSLKAIIASQYGLIVLSVLGAAGAVFLLVRDSRQAGEAKFAAFFLLLWEDSKPPI